MSQGHTCTIVVTTDANGDSTDYTCYIAGHVCQIRYVKTDFAAGVDVAITNNLTGQNIWTEANVDATKTVAPRQATHGEDGVPLEYTSNGETVESHITLGDERIKVVVSNGGDTKTGTFYITTE